MLIPRIAWIMAGVGLWSNSLGQELITLQALGFGPSASSLGPATPSLELVQRQACWKSWSTWAPVLKTSSKSGNQVAWFTDPDTEPCLNF